MNDEGIHVGDSGTIIEVTVTDKSGNIVDLGLATTLQIIFTAPGGGKLTKTATLTTDGSDGKMQYILTGSDFTVPGVYKAQAYVVLPTGSWHSSTYFFEVSDNL